MKTHLYVEAWGSTALNTHNTSSFTHTHTHTGLGKLEFSVRNRIWCISLSGAAARVTRACFSASFWTDACQTTLITALVNRNQSTDVNLHYKSLVSHSFILIIHWRNRTGLLQISAKRWMKNIFFSWRIYNTYIEYISILELIVLYINNI